MITLKGQVHYLILAGFSALFMTNSFAYDRVMWFMNCWGFFILYKLDR
jgi:hypothetical protein